jgi:hypothetical protein
MPYILLGLSAVMISWGVFLTVSSAFSKGLRDVIRAGRFTRGVITEVTGLLLFMGAWGFGARPTFAIPVLIVSMALPGMVAIVHALLQNRLMAQRNSAASPE